MRRMLVIAGLAIVCAACGDREPNAPAQQPRLATMVAGYVQRVVAGGSLLRVDLPGSPREMHAFNAVLEEDGRVQGTAETHLAGGANLKVDVQCLVIRANRAWLSGPVTRSDDASLPVGSAIVWRVEDNGQGPDAPPDRVGVAAASGPMACTSRPFLPLHDWDNGGVSISATGGPALSDIVGTWNAVVYYYLDPADPAELWDVMGDGIQARWVIAPDGRFVETWTFPGGAQESTRGSIDVVNGRFQVRLAGAPYVIVPDPLRLTGSKLQMELDVPSAHDWNGDGVPDDSHVVVEWRRQH